MTEIKYSFGLRSQNSSSENWRQIQTNFYVKRIHLKIQQFIIS